MLPVILEEAEFLKHRGIVLHLLPRRNASLRKLESSARDATAPARRVLHPIAERPNGSRCHHDLDRQCGVEGHANRRYYGRDTWRPTIVTVLPFLPAHRHRAIPENRRRQATRATAPDRLRAPG